MSNHDEPGFDDPAFDDVRDLLAGARVTDPVPADVADRLDATLASLQAERAAESAAVVPLRRRLGPRVGRVLVAAASIVVIGAGGVGVAQLAGNSGSDDGAATADEAQSADTGGSADAPTPATTPVPLDGLESAPKVDDRSLREATQLTTAAFADDAALLMLTLDRLEVTATTGRLPDDADSPADPDELDSDPARGSDWATLQAPPVTATPEGAYLQQDNAATTCAGPEAPGSVIVRATLDGGPVALVFRPPADDVQRVEAWSCDGTTLLAAATVPS